MSPREMGKGSWLRVNFGKKPKGSPVKGGGCLPVLYGLAGIAAGLAYAAHQATGYL